MIEKAGPEHLDAIMALWLKTNVSAHPFIPETYWKSAFDQVRDAMPAADLFMYRGNAGVAGFIGVTGNRYVAGLFVDGKFQSQGIGRKLLDHCKQRYPRLELDVFTENAGAVRFYQNNGFAIAGTEMNPDFGHTEHRMLWAAAD